MDQICRLLPETERASFCLQCEDQLCPADVTESAGRFLGAFTPDGQLAVGPCHYDWETNLTQFPGESFLALFRYADGYLLADIEVTEEEGVPCVHWRRLVTCSEESLPSFIADVVARDGLHRQ